MLIAYIRSVPYRIPRKPLEKCDKRIPETIYKVLKNYYEMLKSGEIKLFGWGKFRWFESFISLNFFNFIKNSLVINVF